MRSKIFIALLTVISFLAISTTEAASLVTSEASSEKYLYEHGHSKDLIRMINIQKDRTESNTDEALRPKSEHQGPFKKLLKNLWFEKDITLPLSDFGHDEIETPETDRFVSPVNMFKSKDIQEP